MNSSPYKMISIPEAQAIVLGNTLVLGSEEIPLSHSEGRNLSESVTAKDDLPPFPASIKVPTALNGAVASSIIAI